MISFINTCIPILPISLCEPFQSYRACVAPNIFDKYCRISLKLSIICCGNLFRRSDNLYNISHRLICSNNVKKSFYSQSMYFYSNSHSRHDFSSDNNGLASSSKLRDLTTYFSVLLEPHSLCWLVNINLEPSIIEQHVLVNVIGSIVRRLWSLLPRLLYDKCKE